MVVRPISARPGRPAAVVLCAVAVMAGPAALSVTASASGELPDPVPVPELAPIEQPDAESARLIPVPAGCLAPDVEQVVFIGRLLLADAVTARFEVEQVLSGSIDGFTVNGMIDVRYGDEVRFLDDGQRYIVGGGIDQELRVLASTVRSPAPLFGGNEIAGVDDADVDCPQVDSPVRTVLVDGSSVETGVLTPLQHAERRILGAVLVPVGVAFAVLLGLVVVKHLFFALGRSMRDLSVTDRPSLVGRRRRRRVTTDGGALDQLERLER